MKQNQKPQTKAWKIYLLCNSRLSSQPSPSWLLFYFFVSWDIVSCSLGWPQTYCVAKDNLNSQSWSLHLPSSSITCGLHSVTSSAVFKHTFMTVLKLTFDVLAVANESGWRTWPGAAFLCPFPQMHIRSMPLSVLTWEPGFAGDSDWYRPITGQSAEKQGLSA